MRVRIAAIILDPIAEPSFCRMRFVIITRLLADCIGICHACWLTVVTTRSDGAPSVSRPLGKARARQCGRVSQWRTLVDSVQTRAVFQHRPRSQRLQPEMQIVRVVDGLRTVISCAADFPNESPNDEASR